MKNSIPARNGQSNVSYLPTAHLAPVVNRKRGRLPRSVAKIGPAWFAGQSVERANDERAQQAAHASRIRTPAEIVGSLIAHLEAVLNIANTRMAEFEAQERARAGQAGRKEG
ncbi:hypothetical protein ACOTEY_29005 [Achromobacter xylosoxidans]